MARSHLRIDSPLDDLSCAQTVEDHEPIDVAEAIVHGCHSRFLLVTCYITDSQGVGALNLMKLARLGALVHTMNLPYVIVGDFNMTPEELIATQWIDQIRGQIVLPHATVSTCSNGGRVIDSAVISPVLARNVDLTVDLDDPFRTPQQLASEVAHEYQSRHDYHTIETTSHTLENLKMTPRLRLQTKSGVESSQLSRFFVPVSSRHVLCSKLLWVYQSFGAISSLVQPKKLRNWLKRLWNLRQDMREPPEMSAAKAPRWLEHTRCGRPRFQLTSVTSRFFLEGCGYLGFPREMLAYRLGTFGGVRCSPQVFTHGCSVTPAQHLQSFEEVALFHAACDAQRVDLGRLP